MTDQVIDEIFTIRTSDDGTRYLKVKGRRGWPLKMLDDELPEDTVRRYEEKRQARKEQQNVDSASFSLDDAPTEASAGAEDLPPKKRADPLPRPRGGKTKGRIDKGQLEKMVAEMLALPAIPAATLLRCQYCAAHFARSSRQTAKELITLAEENEPLRRLFERMYEAWSTIGYASILGGYILKPLVHHLAPYEVRRSVGPFIGVPLNSHDHHNPEFLREQQEAQARAAHVAAEAERIAREEAARAADPATAAPAAP